MEFCSVGKRFSAYLVDVLVQVVGLGLVAFLLEYQAYLAPLWCGVPLFVFSWLYFAVMESSKYQATLGKLLLGAKVVDLNGKQISFAKATGRYYAKFLTRITLGIGYLMAFFTKKKQCLHDKLADTLVIKN